MLEALLQGDHFENRPDWVRFEKMFGGDKNNSLAFCDMSNLQVSSIKVKKDFNEKPQTARRRLLGPHTFPAAGLAINCIHYAMKCHYRSRWQPDVESSL